MTSAQTIPCENSHIINDDPITEGLYQASDYILSTGKVHSMSTVGFGSFGYTLLEEGFEVELQATFIASMNGCEMDCVGDDCDPDPEVECVEEEPCLEAPCPLLATKIDSRGRSYEPGVIIISQQNGGQGEGSSMSATKGFLDAINSLQPTDSTIERCLCDYDIFIYQTLVPINEEGTIGQASGGSGTNGEGNIFSLNYYVNLNYENHMDVALTSTFDPQQFSELGTQDSPMLVAFLDTGIDPALLPKNILNVSQPSNCLTDDYFGWNFIDNNNDILDRRGHGTTVVLNYINALETLGIPYQNQSILPIKVLDECSRGTTYSIVCGLYYAKSKGAAIVNNSWGLYFNDIQIQEAIAELSNDNIAISCSAGNLALDLDMREHFPSGYAHDFVKIRSDYTTIDTTGIQNVFEVGGICRSVLDTSPATTANIWPLSNHRDFMFAEAAIKVEDLLNGTGSFSPEISCGISGTSYAAAQFTAGLVHFASTNPGVRISQRNVESRSQQINPDETHYSYILDKL